MMKEPESMDELVYFTNRFIGEGFAKAWVYRKECPECGKALMGKPVDPKTGDVKIRAKEYKCPECGYTVEKKEYEESLDCDIKYKCPFCNHEGEKTVPYKRKTYKGVKAIVFNCDECNEKIALTKKMKPPKK
ncbi:MAG: hypothetical protein ACQEP1_03485 [Nanobdellota archaeon]